MKKAILEFVENLNKFGKNSRFLEKKLYESVAGRSLHLNKRKLNSVIEWLMLRLQTHHSRSFRPTVKRKVSGGLTANNGLVHEFRPMLDRSAH